MSHQPELQTLHFLMSLLQVIQHYRILGNALEHEFGCHLTIGPPLERGFYYDGYYGPEKRMMSQEDFTKVEVRAKEVVKSAAPFEML